MESNMANGGGAVRLDAMLERAGYEFMAGANGRPGLWVRRSPARVTVIRVSRDGWTATDYDRESYPDGGRVIASADGGLELLDAIKTARRPSVHELNTAKP